MLLQCPHCATSGEHMRSDLIGNSVVCPICELPFAWRQAVSEADAASARRQAVTGEREKPVHSVSNSTRNER